METTSLKSITNIESLTDSAPHEQSTKNERLSWACYAFGRAAFETIAIDSIYPLFLSFLALEGGSTYTIQQNSTSLPNFSNTTLFPADGSWYVSGSCTSALQCVVPWLGMYVRPATFALSVMSLAVLFNLFLLFALNALVDHSGYRKMVRNN